MSPLFLSVSSTIPIFFSFDALYSFWSVPSLVIYYRYYRLIICKRICFPIAPTITTEILARESIYEHKMLMTDVNSLGISTLGY